MHGVLFTCLKQFYEDQGLSWETLRQRCGLLKETTFLQRLCGIQYPDYETDKVYPDLEFTCLLSRVDIDWGVRQGEHVVESFGRYLGRAFLHQFETEVDPTWRTFDVLENLDALLLRMKSTTPGIEPPRFTTRRDGERMELTYVSSRKLCRLGVGIIRGIADHFGESLWPTHHTCVHRGARECIFEIRPLGSGSR